MNTDKVIEPGTIVRMPGIEFAYRLTGEQNDGKQAQVEVTADPQVLFAPPHIHLHEDESIYIVEGVCRVQHGTDVFEAGAGESIFIPIGTPHALANAGNTPTRVLLTITPAGMEPFFFELAEVLGDGPPLPTEAFDDVEGFMESVLPPSEVERILSTLTELWAKYGIQGAQGAK